MIEGQGPYSIGQDIWEGLAKVQEESNELGVVLAKIIALGGRTNYWDGRNLGAELHDEIADVYAALDFFTVQNKLNAQFIEARRTKKVTQFNKWSRNCRADNSASLEQPEAAGANQVAKG